MIEESAMETAAQNHHHYDDEDRTAPAPQNPNNTTNRDCSNVTRYICLHRKFSLIFLLTVLIFCMLTFMCEQGLIFPSACASASVVDNYGDRIKVKTSDAGIFVGVKEVLKINPNRDSNNNNDDNNNLESSMNTSPHHLDRDSSHNHNNIHSHSHRPNGNSENHSHSTENGGPKSEENSGLKADEKVYYVFKGIPYAQPPVGSLRWKDPQVVDIKSSAQDNTKYKPVCSQWSDTKKRPIGSTDCLYLNIHTPHIPPPLRRAFLPNPYTVQDIFYQQRHLYPVLIHIHGGDFLKGSGNFYGAKKLLLSEDVCLVTFSYRLGIFGFLSSGDDEIPGNYGLLDQLMAIKWVQKYIQRFGGNPTRVTIFGDVGYLLLSPLAVGLFQGAILMSDSMSMFSPPGNRSIQWDSRQLIREIAEAANCPVAPLEEIDINNNNPMEATVATPTSLKAKKEIDTQNGAVIPESALSPADKETEMMIDCLKLTPADHLVRIQHSMMKFDSYPRRFVPVVDAGFRDFAVMMSDPEELMEMGTLVKVPIIAGVNQLEGYSMLLDFTQKLGFNNLRDPAKIRQTLYENVNYVLEEQTTRVYDEVFESVWKFYFGQQSDAGYSKGLTKKLLALFGDLKTHAGFWKLSKKLTRNSKPPAFAYVFSHRVNEFNQFFRQQAAAPNFPSSNNLTLTSSSPKGRFSRHQHSIDQNQMEPVIIPPWQDLHYILEPSSDKIVNLSLLSSSTTQEGNEEREDKSVNGTLSMDEIMVKIWTSFSNYGTPKLAVGKFENWTRWHRIEAHSVRYYDLSMHPMSMKTSFRTNEALFWYESLPEVRAAARKAEEEDEEKRKNLIWWIILISSILSFFILVGLIYYCCFT